MSERLSDKDLSELASADRLDIGSPFMLWCSNLAAVETQRWRAAFAWLERVSGSVEGPGIYEGPGWCAWADDTRKHAIGDTVLEAIEALRAKVEAKP
jgi:hypothetical protein